MTRGMLWTSLALWIGALGTIAASVGWVAWPLLAGWSAAGLAASWMVFRCHERGLLLLGAGTLIVLCVLGTTPGGLLFLPSSMTLFVAASLWPAPTPSRL